MRTIKIGFALLIIVIFLPFISPLSAATDVKQLISVQHFNLRYAFMDNGEVRIYTSSASYYELWFDLGGQNLTKVKEADQKGKTVYVVYVQCNGKDEYCVSVKWQFSTTTPFVKWTATGEWYQGSTFTCKINLNDLATTLELKNKDTRAEFGKLFFDWSDTVTAGAAPQEHGKSGSVFSTVWKVDQKFELDPTIGQTEGVATAQQVGWSYMDSEIGAWWRLDEGSGAASSDSSGHGNTFILYNSAWVDGKFGEAVLCSGSTSGAYASDSSYLSPSNVTVAAWINIRSFSSWAYQTVACKGYTYYVVYALYVNSDHKLSFAARISGTDYSVAGTTVLQPNTWYRAVGTFNGTCLGVYLNGECENSVTHSGSLSTTDQSFKIGWGWFGGTQDSFNGTIDEVCVYDRGMGSSEVHDDYVRTWTSAGYYWANNAADTTYRYNFSFAFPTASSQRVLSCTFPKGHSITNVTSVATGTALYPANYTVGAFNSTHNYVQLTENVIAIYGSSFILFTHATCGVYDVRLEYNPPSTHYQFVSPRQSVRLAVQLRDPYGNPINPQTTTKLINELGSVIFTQTGTPLNGWLNTTETMPSSTGKYYLQSNCSGDYAGISYRTIYVVNITVSFNVNDSRLDVGKPVQLSGVARYYLGDSWEGNNNARVPSGSITVANAGTYAISEGYWSGTITKNEVCSVTFTVTSVNDGGACTVSNTPSRTVVWDGLKVTDYQVDVADEMVYACMLYAYGNSPIQNGTVVLTGVSAHTNSTGWAAFNMTSAPDFSWNQTIYGNQDCGDNLLAYDDFSVDSTANYTTANPWGWSVYDPAEKAWECTGYSGATCYYNVRQFSDPYYVEAEIKISNNQHCAGLYFNFQNTTNYYVFVRWTDIYGYNFFSIIKVVGDHAFYLNSTAGVPAVGEYKRYAVSISSDGLITGYYDGVVKVTARDTTFTSGYVGFYRSAFYAATWFDNFRVRKDVNPLGYGITFSAQTQNLPIAKKTRFIQSDAEISGLSWDGVKLTIQFATPGSYTLEVSGPRPTYILNTTYDLSNDYIGFLRLCHDGSRPIRVSYATWGDFYVRSLSQGWITDIYWTSQELTLAINGSPGTSGTLTIYCGSRASPQKTSGFSSTLEYNAGTTILSGEYALGSQVALSMDWALSGGSGSSGGSIGGGGIPFTFTAGTLIFKANPGMTVNAVLNFTWMGTNQITITNIRFNGAAANWVTLADTLPKTVTKEVGAIEGYGEVGICLLVSNNAQPGEYEVPAQIDAEAVGSQLTTSGWITITVMKPAAPITMVPDFVTYLFAMLLLFLVAYAYIKKR